MRRGASVHFFRERPVAPYCIDTGRIGGLCPLTLGGHVNTISDQRGIPSRRRRLHSDEFKADAVASCMQPGMSMAAVAIAHGVNANLLRRWVREAELRPPGIVLDKPTARGMQTPEAKPLFVPVSLPSPVPAALAPTSASNCSAVPQRSLSPGPPAPPASAPRGSNRSGFFRLGSNPSTGDGSRQTAVQSE